MRPLAEFTHYEILDLSPGATPFEIRRAYKGAQEIYREDSIVSYSFFSEEERKEILARIEEAFSALMNEKKRAAYDQMLIQQGVIREEAQYLGACKRPSTPASIQSDEGTKPPPAELRRKAAENPVVQEILSREVLTGMDLKRLRTELGVSLEHISEKTKIRTGLFQFIEENNFDELPSRLHLKSFLKAYAQFLQLDPESIVNRYLKQDEIVSG